MDPDLTFDMDAHEIEIYVNGYFLSSVNNEDVSDEAMGCIKNILSHEEEVMSGNLKITGMNFVTSVETDGDEDVILLTDKTRVYITKNSVRIVDEEGDDMGGFLTRPKPEKEFLYFNESGVVKNGRIPNIVETYPAINNLDVGDSFVSSHGVGSHFTIIRTK